MDVSSLSSVAQSTLLEKLSGINYNSSENNNNISATENSDFSSILNSAFSLVSETNELTDAAEEAEINFALGLADNTHDVQIAQQKALVSLQYTVAVKNQLLSAYQEIMQIQV